MISESNVKLTIALANPDLDVGSAELVTVIEMPKVANSTAIEQAQNFVANN
ncbi:MAG: hypothetical protein V7L23_14775 [Nostoc sp.]|uniref:hypothetical protein n=1 Tax=Nostoc sp. TaxID=1180 RepID=UPI002FF13FFA